VKRLLPLLLLAACSSASGMLRVQSQLWREGGIAHLARTQPADHASPAWLDWRSALEVAANTVCTEDQRAKLKGAAACRCADGGLDAESCADFLAGKP
jgi:hypothetical protein